MMANVRWRKEKEERRKGRGYKCTNVMSLVESKLLLLYTSLYVEVERTRQGDDLPGSVSIMINSEETIICLETKATVMIIFKDNFFLLVSVDSDRRRKF